MIRFILLFLLLPLALTCKEKALKVGMELAYPPFETICPDGLPCGISVDIAKDLGKYLHRKTVIENIPFIGLVPSLKTEKIDAIISSMTITPGRKRSINFSMPYATIGLSLLISEDSTVHGIEDVNKEGMKVVVKSGTSGEVYAAKNLPLARIRILDKESMCVLEVVQGKADVFIYDQLSIYRNWQRNLSTTRVNLKSFQNEYWGIGIAKDNPELLSEVNSFIEEYHKKDRFNKLAKKYLSKELSAFKELEIPFIF
ncbi:MAG: transporter substrate-binding domain-containing protein [Parachlamydiales bacterium]|jgi:polar amino acid transport system substrate-binding protein